MDTHKMTDTTTKHEIETVEGALADLKLGDEDAVIEELSADESAALDLSITKSELYSKAGADVKIAADIAAPAGDVAVTKKERKARTPKAPKAAKAVVVRDLNILPASLFQISKDSTITDAEAKIAMIAARPKQKKIAEKFDNVFAALNVGKAPSRYVVDLFRLLDTKKSVTSTELVNAMMGSASGRGSAYGEGTARSQTGQIMELFNVLGIADRTKNSLVLRADSVIATHLRKFI